MYFLADLAQDVLSKRAESHGWPFQAFEGKASLPGDIFKSHSSKEESLEVGFM